MNIYNDRKLKAKDLIPIFILIIAFSIFGYFIYRNRHMIIQIQSISPWTIFQLSILVLFSTFQNGLINFILYQAMHVQIDLISSFGLATINTMANQLPLSGGLVAKGYYLYKKYKLPVSQYISATGALYICFLSTNGIVGLLSLCFLYLIQKVAIPGYLVAGFGLMFMSFIVLFIPFNRLKIPIKFQKYSDGIEMGWNVLRSNKTLLVKLISIQILSIILMALRFGIALNSFSQEVTIIDSMLIASTSILTQLVNIVPGGLGLREGLAAAVAAVLGFDPGVTFVAVGFDRIVSTTIIIILGLYFSYVMGKSVVKGEFSRDKEIANNE